MQEWSAGQRSMVAETVSSPPERCAPAFGRSMQLFDGAAPFLDASLCPVNATIADA